MNIDRETIKQYLSLLTPAELAQLAAELREDWRLPEPVVIDEPTPPPAIVGWDVVLTDLGSSKVATIRALRASLELDLRGARALIDPLPSTLHQAPSQDAAERLADVLREAGASIEVRPVTG